MAYTINRRLADLITSTGVLETGKIPADYITNAHIADNTLTAAQLHTTFAVGSAHIPANLITIAHLAVTDGTANQVLKTDGSGALSFTTIEADKIQEGNSYVEVTDTGSNGTITMRTEGTDRWEVTSGGHILPLLDDTYDIGSASKKVRDIYVSTGSIKMGADTVLSINSDGDFEINDASGDPKKLKVDEIEIGTGTDKLILKRGTDGKLESRKKVNGTLQAAEKLFSIASHTTDDITEGDSKLFYTDARADARVALIVDSSPPLLNTLNELAAALGDNENFATDVAASIGTKWTQNNTKLSQWDTAYGWGNHASAGYVTTDTNTTYSVGNGGLTQINFTSALNSKLSGIAASANNYVLPFTNNSTNWNTAYGWGNHASAGYTNDQTAAEILTAIKTVDGSGSGLDADLLDGQQGSYYAPASHNHSGVYLPISAKAADSELLDGIDSTGFVKQLSDSSSGPNYFTPSSRRVDPHASNPTNAHYAISTFGNGGNVTGQLATHLSSGEAYTRGYNSSWSGWRKVHDSVNLVVGAGGLTQQNFTTTLKNKLDGIAASANNFTETLSATNTATITGLKYFKTAGTMASPLIGTSPSLQAYSSGGNYAAYMAFHRSSHYAINWGLDTSNAMVLGGWSSSTTVPRMSIGTNGLMVTAGQGTLWGSSNDGAGSGLDADLLDGQQGSYYYAASNPAGYTNATNDRFYISDTRGANRAPSYYDDRYVQADFTQNAYLGVSGGDSWATVLTVSKWASWDSSHRQEQLIFAGTKLCRRVATSDSAWSSTYTIWDSSTDGSGSGLDADLLDGANSDTAANANTIVKRDGNGYINGVYFNSAIGISEGLSLDITKIYVSNDNYIRTMGKSNFKIRMGLTKSEYDRMDYSTNTRYHIGSNSHNDVTFNQLWGRGSGFIDNWNTGAGKPPSGTHFNGFQGLHYTDGGSYHHGMQMAMSAGNPALTFLRGHWANGGTGSAWQKIWTDGNDGSGSGLDSDLLDGQQGSYYASVTHANNEAASRARTASSYSGNQNMAAAALQFQSSSSGQGAHGYAIFQEGGAWSHPYPDLRIAFHTGVKIGGHYNYGGTRIYNNSDMVTLLFSVGNGEQHCRATNNMYAAGFLYQSDRAYKENIYPLENSLEKVLQFNGVNYTRKEDSVEHIGFIAQDVEKIEPKLVDGEEGSKSVNYGQMVALLTEAMKEQQNMIVALQEEVKELKNAIK